MSLSITENDKKFIASVVQKHLPQAKIWCFGSRARGDHKNTSDLDLLIDNKGLPIDLNTLGNIKEALTQSFLIYKVDIVDGQRISDDFKAKIKSELVPFITDASAHFPNR